MEPITVLENTEIYNPKGRNDMRKPKPIKNGHILTEDAAINIYSLEDKDLDYIFVVDKSVKQKAARALDTAFQKVKQDKEEFTKWKPDTKKQFIGRYLSNTLTKENIEHETYCRLQTKEKNNQA